MSIAIAIHRTTADPGAIPLTPSWEFAPSVHPPFATILAPDDAEVGTTGDGGRALFLWPDAPGFSARLAYESARQGRHGLSLVKLVG